MYFAFLFSFLKAIENKRIEITKRTEHYTLAFFIAWNEAMMEGKLFVAKMYLAHEAPINRSLKSNNSLFNTRKKSVRRAARTIRQSYTNCVAVLRSLTFFRTFCFVDFSANAPIYNGYWKRLLRLVDTQSLFEPSESDCHGIYRLFHWLGPLYLFAKYTNFFNKCVSGKIL